MRTGRSRPSSCRTTPTSVSASKTLPLAAEARGRRDRNASARQGSIAAAGPILVSSSRSVSTAWRPGRRRCSSGRSRRSRRRGDPATRDPRHAAENAQAGTPPWLGRRSAGSSSGSRRRSGIIRAMNVGVAKEIKGRVSRRADSRGCARADAARAQRRRRAGRRRGKRVSRLVLHRGRRADRLGRGGHQADSRLVLKVKPIPEEFGRLREGQVLFPCSPSRGERGAHEGADGERRSVCRVRDRRNRRSCAAAARADEWIAGRPGLTGGSDVPREAARRARAAAGRRARVLLPGRRS